MNKAICTLITNDYLPNGLVCHEYLKESNPDTLHYIFTVGTLGKTNNEILRNHKNIRHIPLEKQLNTELMDKLICKYSPFEICNALRGCCHRYIYENTEIDQWLMIDSDIAIINSLSDIFSDFEQSEILITPHGSLPNINKKAVITNEMAFLRNGIYNSGLIGFKRGEISYKAILWMEERLLSFSEFSKNRLDSGIPREFDFLFVDQLWINLLPIYFRKCKISFESRFNLGHWNLWEGKLSYSKENKYLFKNKEVVAFHFSGLSLTKLENVSKHSTIYTEKPNMIWAKASKDYLSKLSKIKNKTSAEKYSYLKKIPKISKKLIILKYINKILMLMANKTERAVLKITRISKATLK